MRKNLSALAAALVLGCATTETAAPRATEKPAATTMPPAAPAAMPAPAPGSPPTPDAAFRAQKPAALPGTPTFDAPVPVVKKLKNGTEVWVIENSAIPVVAVEVVIQSGVNAEPIAKAGLADLVVSLLDEGTKTRSADKLAEAIEDLAMELNANAGREDIRVHMNSLTETLPQALDLMADVLLNPAFKQEDVDRVKALKITALEQKKGTPFALAADEMGRLLFGAKHPWGQPDGGTPQTLRAITPADLQKFHDTWFRPNNALIVVSGDVKADQVVKLLDERLASWKAKPLPKLTLPPLPELKERSVTFVDKPNNTQSQVWVAGRVMNAKDPDALPLRTANFALGGLFTSRLNMNLRENKGYSYGVFSRVECAKTFGTMIALGGIVAKNTSEALKEYEDELSKFSSGGITDEELARSKNAFIRTMPSRLETNDAMASAYATANFYGLGADYYKTLPEKIAALTTADAARVAKVVAPDRWPIIVVGPAEGNADKVKKLGLGPVEVKPVPSSGGGASSK
jgi:zinc protease